MALKDWKNLMNTSDRKSYENKKTGIKLVIIPYGDIRVFTVKVSNPTKSIVNRRFKTTMGAINFGTKYMKTH